jgi:hypothetical protein
MAELLLACLHRRIQLVHERGIQMPEAMKPRAAWHSDAKYL